jgi:general secretion pathway protein M
LRAAEQQHAQLDAQLQHMLGLQAQAKRVQAQPRLAPDEARRLLEASVKPLGATAQLVVAGERATLTFKAMPADTLLQWLTQARLNAHAVPSQAHWVRSAPGLWDGTLVLSLAAP